MPMAHKYCEKHKIYYDWNDTCPECYKVAGIVGDIIGGSIYAVATAGKKIVEKIKEDKYTEESIKKSEIDAMKEIQPKLSKMSAEKEILMLAKKRDVLTLKEIIENTNLGIDEAESALEKLISREMATKEIEPSGKTTYIFELSSQQKQQYKKIIKQEIKILFKKITNRTLFQMYVPYDDIVNIIPGLSKSILDTILKELIKEGYIGIRKNYWGNNISNKGKFNSETKIYLY